MVTRPSTVWEPNRLGEVVGLSIVDRNIVVMALGNSVDDTPDMVDWRIPLTTYLRDPSVRTDRSIRWTTFKYVLINDELYRRNPSNVMLKCLGPNDVVLAMAEIH